MAPVSGIILTDLQDYLNYAFFDTLPIEFMYFECFAQSLYAGFYVGAYGLVANFSRPSQRAQRFARMDAISLLAFTISVAVSDVRTLVNAILGFSVS